MITINLNNYKPESPYVATHRGVVINSICSQAFLFGESNMNNNRFIRKDSKFVIYKITHIDSGKSYIGMTMDYLRRMKNHFNDNNPNCRYLHRAIKKYNKVAFQHKILYRCNSWETLCQKEKEYIRLFKTKSPKGYNLTDGGEGIYGLKHSDESKKKMSESSKGRIVSLETRRKLSEINKGHIVSNAARKKISNSHKGRTFSKETLKKMSDAGKTKIFSDETRKKISESQKIFSKNQILEIRKLLKIGIFQSIIAKKFNTVQSAISSIKLNKHYSEIQLEQLEQ